MDGSKLREWSLKKLKLTSNHYLYASISEQKLYHWHQDHFIRSYSISTSRNPPSCVENSLGTPLGWHAIADKIGDGQPKGMVFKGRVPTGVCYSSLSSEQQSDNLITSRILRLQGMEPGVNAGPGIDTYQRYVYIHGTNQEDRIGQPNSHGCLLLNNDDMIDLFDQIPSETLLLIET